MKKSLWEALKSVLWDHRYRFSLGCSMVAASNALLILNPLVFRQAVMAIAPSDPLSLPHPFFFWLFGESIIQVWVWIPLLISIAIVSAFFKYGMRIVLIGMSRDAELETRSKLFARIQHQSMVFFDRYGIGELLSRLTNDISAYREVLGPGILYPLFFVTLVGPGIIALFYISPSLASMALIPLLAIPLVNLAISKSLFSVSRKVQKTLGEMSNMVQEHYTSIRVMKSYTMENWAWERFQKLCLQFMHVNQRFFFLQGTLFPFFVFLTKIVTVGFVLLAAFLMMKGWSELSTADFLSFMWIQSYIFFPIIMLGWLIPIYEKGKAAYERLVEIYEEPIEVIDRTDPFHSLQIPKRASLTFRNLSFSYPPHKVPVLQDVSFEVKGGEFLGIVGPVGAGKSTLFRLLNREYEIPEGMIFIEGKDIHLYPLSAFHREMATVEQVPFLFSKSIRENLRFGKQEASQEEIEEVSRYADFHETVLDFSEKYETPVGERGVTLSGGQKQRLAMARAFLVNRSILLLDDIFSAVDAGTEERIFKKMKEYLKGKTVLLITHRATLLKKMDSIVVLSEGRVVEKGTPEALLAKRGHFAALLELDLLRYTQTNSN